MTDTQTTHTQAEKRSFLPLGSVVILKGSVKKLLIASRGSIVEGDFFDYGAFLYPEGMIDTNIAYFKARDIMKVVHEGYRDDDDALVLEILNDAYDQFLRGRSDDAVVAEMEVVAVSDDDPFASVRDMADGDE